MNDTELEQIVQRMIDAGEPETSIAAVVKQYDADMATEAAGAPTPEGQVEPLERGDIFEAASDWLGGTMSWAKEGLSNSVPDGVKHAFGYLEGEGLKSYLERAEEAAARKEEKLLNAEELINDAVMGGKASSYISDFYDDREETMAPQLQSVLNMIPRADGQSDWSVEQGIGYGVTDWFNDEVIKGSGSEALLSNNITITNPNGVKRNFSLDQKSNSDIKREIAEFIARDKKKSTMHLKQEANLKSELATAFNDNPSLYGEMLDQSKMTLADKEAYESDPTEYLREKVRDHVGGFGWFFPSDRADEYSKLSNAEINEAVDDVFNLNLQQELTNRRAVLRDSSDEATYVEGGGTSRDWHDKDRAGAIATYAGKNLEIARLVEDLNHGGLNEADWKATHKKYKDLKEKIGKTYGVIDLFTGEQRHTDNLTQAQELAEKLVSERGGVESVSVLDTDSAEAQYEGLDIDDLQLEYERSVLELSGFNNEIKNTVLEFDEVDTSLPQYLQDTRKFEGAAGYLPTAGDLTGAKAFAIKHQHQTIGGPPSMTMEQYMKTDWGYGYSFGEKNPLNWVPKGFTQEEWKARIANYRQQQIDFTTDNAALQRMYLLNEGIMDEDMTVLNQVHTAGKSFLTPFVGASEAQRIFGSTHAEELDRLSGGYDMAGFEKTEEEISWAERSTGEQVNEGIFGTGKLLLELAGAGKVLKAVEAVEVGGMSLDAIATWANASRYKNLATGATYTTAKLKKRADAVGLTVADYARKFKLAETGVGIKQLGVGTTYAAIHEGIVFEGVTRYDTGGKESGFVGGATFGAVGNLTRMIAPALVRKGRLKDFDTKGLGKPGSLLEKNTRMRVNTQKMFELGMQPTNFIVAMEMAETMDALYDDAMGTKEFSTFMDEHYGDYGDVMQRFIVNGWMGLGLGQANSNGVISKGFVDYKSKAGIKETQNFARKKLEQLAGQVGVKPNEIYIERTTDSGETYTELNPKLYDPVTGLSKSGGKKSNLSQFEKHLDVHRDMGARYMQAMRAEGYMNPLRAQETITRDMKPIIAENAKNGIETRVEIVDNNNLKPGQKGLENKNAEVVLDGKVKTYRFNIERYTPGVQAHEVGHDFFDQRFGSDAMFTGEFYEKLSNLGNKIELEQKITEAEANKLGLNWEVVKNKNLTLTQALELKDFGVADPVQQQKIRHWEMFSHLAERMGSFENYQKLSDAYAFESLGEMINSFGNKMGQKYDLTTEKDIVEWFKDYGQTLGKKRSPAEMFEHLDNFVHYGTKEGETAIKDAEAKSEGRTSSKSDTYSSERLDVGADIKINDPKVLAAKIQQEYEDKIASAESKEAAFRDLMDPGRRSPHYDTRYPVVGNKIGPLLDIAINSYNKTIPERYRIDLKNRSFDSERTEFVTDIAYADKRGLPDILAKYSPINPVTGKPQKLATWIVGQVRLRSQEIKGRGIDRRSESRAAEKEGVVISGTDISEINQMFEDVGAGEGMIDRGESVKEGIRLNDFNWKRGEVEGAIPPSSIEAIRVSAKNTFKDMPIEKLDSYMNVTTGMHSEVRPEIDALFGFVEGAKPKQNVAAGNKFIKDNGAMLYDAMHLTSNPKFYENTNAAKTIFRDFYKDTGVKYKTSELSTQEAARTNARANKFEKLPATAEVVDKFIETATTGRDAGTILKKHATYKDMLSQVWGGQNFRDIVDIKTEAGRDFIENEVPNIKDGAKKIEVLKAELALRKLKGATPETLASDILVKNEIMELYREVDFANQRFPGFHFKRIVESDSRFKDFFDKTGGVDAFIKDHMGYDLTSANENTWQKYAEATRQLGLQNSGAYKPIIFSGGYKGKKGRLGVHEVLYKMAEDLGIPRDLLNISIDQSKRTADPVFSRNYVEKFLPDFFNTFDATILKRLEGAIGKTMGEGDLRFGFRDLVDYTKKDGTPAKRKEIFNAPLRKDILKNIDGVSDIPVDAKTGEPIFNAANAKVNDNVTVMKQVARVVEKSPNINTSEGKKEAAENIKKLLSPGKTVESYDKMIETNEAVLYYAAGKIFDYLSNAKTIEAKAEAINNLSYMLQAQTNLGGGLFRGLATHNAVSIKRGKKHSEHDFQLGNFTGNMLVDALSNSGNRAAFDINMESMVKAYKQSIIDKITQQKFDGKEYGGGSGFDFIYTTESGKYMWLREKVLAATTLDLATGKTYDQLMSDVIGGAKGLRTLENVSADMLKKTVYASENLSGPERLEAMKVIDKALANGRKRNAKRKGMSTWDFDDTLAHTKSDVIVNDPSVKQAKMYNGSPKSFSKLGGRSGVVFLASEAREAKAYADSQGGKVREIYIDNNKVGTEKQLLEKIEELGYSTEDALAYELIDTRFPNSLKQSEINRVIEALKKDGLLGINYTDGAQVVGGTTKSTMVFDKAIISKKPMGSRKISAEEFADQGAKLLEQGFEFDFSEFNKVTGGEPGPFLEKALERAKKFGTKDQFVLTARAPESAPAIYEFLKSQGLNIPLENITGLGNSTGEAKAQWMLEKFAEGYNDMYFADDMMQNVEAVRDVLSQLDIKSKVQQARRLASDNLDLGINEMIERSTGIDAVKEFSGAKARMLGKKRYTKSLVVPGAQDFMGLMQNFLGRGKQGNKDIKFFEDNLVAPFARSTKAMNEARQTSSEDLKRLYKDIPSVKKKLNKNIKNSAFTYDQAIRSYLWEKAGYEVPGLSAKDLKQMTDVVKNDAELLAFAEGLQTVSRGDYVKPSEHWVAETIVSDLFNLNNRSNRSKFIEEWTENKNIIFSEANMNKIEATQGAKFREALEDMLYRMETGSNRPSGSNRLANAHMNFINGSVGATMFLNMRSAALQTISATNYLNWAENNPAKAAAAFGNQKQYWKDFSMLWNSPMLKQRRAGLEYNVQEAELAAAVAGQKNKAKAAMSWLIKKGFTPTQLADSFAIAAGGSTYYRNRVKMYKKQGLTEAEAMDRSFLDFQEKTETSQQSSRADLISQQQASALGRTVLAWANTPMQYMRMQEKATRNIINGRGDFKTNASQIAYYGVVQSLIFAALQSALFAYGLDDEEDMDPEDLPGRLDRVVNTVIDGQLRGMGVAGAGVSAIKNTIIEFNKQELKAEDDVWYTEPDHTRTLLQLTSYSPVLGSKLRKLYSAGNTWNWNREVISEMGLDLNNPGLEAGANVIEAVTNVPLARLVRKIDNLKEVADSENQNWQRIAHLMGYSSWDVGTEDQELDAVKAEVKDRVKVKKVSEETIALEKGFIADQKKERSQGQRTTCAAVSGSGERCKKGASGKTYCTIHQKVQQNDTGKKTQCTHIKPDGKRCKVKTASKSGKCYYHD